MIEEKFNQEIIDKIKEKNILPKPRWHFLLKNYLVWSVGFISLLIGAMAFSMIIYLVRNNDWDPYRQAGESFGSFIILTVPYFWILFLAIFVFLVYYNVKHTTNGYRYPLVVILLVNVLASVVFGSAFYSLGIGRAIDDVLGEKAPFYGQIINQRMGYWSSPDDGRLAGVVISIEGSDRFILLDLNRNNWWIINKEEGIGKVIVGEPIRMTGRKVSDNIFEADKFFSAGGPGGGMFKKHQMMTNMTEVRDHIITQDQIIRRFIGVPEPGICPIQESEERLDAFDYLLKNYPEFNDFLINNQDIRRDLENKGLIK